MAPTKKQKRHECMRDLKILPTPVVEIGGVMMMHLAGDRAM